jgi:hypothetical protein
LPEGSMSLRTSATISWFISVRFKEEKAITLIRAPSSSRMLDWIRVAYENKAIVRNVQVFHLSFFS